jgi:hypothetical protein
VSEGTETVESDYKVEGRGAVTRPNDWIRLESSSTCKSAIRNWPSCLSLPLLDTRPHPLLCPSRGLRCALREVSPRGPRGRACVPGS